MRNLFAAVGGLVVLFSVVRANPVFALCSTTSQGDADCNSRTDQTDFEIWRKEKFNELSTKSADFNSDSLIDTVDFEIWRRNFFGVSTNPSITSTPLTPGPTLSSPAPGSGIWVSPQEIASKPTSGTAWTTMKSAADTSLGSSALYFQESKHPQLTLAVALVAARLGPSATCGGQNCREKAAAGILDIMNDDATTGGGDGRVLALGRNLAAYVVAADVINLKSFKPADDQRFRAFLKQIQTKTGHPGACDSLTECHDKRPNNWGTMSGASRIALDLYIGDTADLQKAVRTFKGYIGDRASYAAFNFDVGADEWSCDPANIRPINPINCTKQGHDISGAPIDDVRRGGGFQWPPGATNYAWGGLSAAVAQAELLHRAGYDSYTWENQAIKRAVTFVTTNMASSASNPTEWISPIVNKRYDTSFPVGSAGGGRLMDWTQWTHSR